MLTIDSESMSRSSVKDLSGWTSSAGMPVYLVDDLGETGEDLLLAGGHVVPLLCSWRVDRARAVARDVRASGQGRVTTWAA